MGRLDFRDENFQQGVQSDLDMIALETIRRNSRDEGRRLRRHLSSGYGGSRGGGHATSGWRNRGLFFWIMLIIMIYWFILKPLGL